MILGYQLLPLVTSKLMGDNKEFEVLLRNLMIQPYFEMFFSLLAGENFNTLKIHHG